MEGRTRGDAKRGQRRVEHLRVPVLPEEKALIEENAARAGMSVAKYLREVGQGYRITGVVDYEAVRDIVRVNGDLGRLGGLLKLWLSDDERAAAFSTGVLRSLLGRIEQRMAELSRVAKTIVRPQAAMDEAAKEDDLQSPEGQKNLAAKFSR